MKNKKGFTLIEVLAVIVVLAIIALITTPIINRYIYNSKRQAFESSIYSMFRKYDYEGTYDSLTVLEIDPCDYDEKPNCSFNGKLIVDNVDGKKHISADNITNGNFCANGDSNNLSITEGDCGELDTTAPVIKAVQIVNVTTSSAKVIVTIGEDGVLKSEKYRLLDSTGQPVTDWKNGEPIQKSGNDYISTIEYTGLTANKKYYVEIEIKNNSATNNTTSALYSNNTAHSFTTSNFGTPSITYPRVWETTKTVTLNYDPNVKAAYKVYTEGQFDLYDWIELSGSTFSLEINNYHYYVSLMSTDGVTNYTTTAQIGYVDNENDYTNTKPSATINNYINNQGVNTDEIEISLKDKYSGVKYYCVSTSDLVSNCSGTNGDNTSLNKWVLVSNDPGSNDVTRLHKFSNGGTYYAFVQDYVGNMSDAQDFSFNKIHYDVNGGVGTVPDQIKLKNKPLILSDVIPTKDRFEFMGWSTNKNAILPDYLTKGEYNKNEDVTLYAIYRRKVTVTYNSNEGTGSLDDSVCYVYGDGTSCEITLSNNAFTRQGYTFKGWALGKSGSISFNANAKYSFPDNITVYAGWEANDLIFNDQNYSITFNNYVQNVEITGATNGNGNYTYTETSEKNTVSNSNTNYMSVNSSTGRITINANTPAGTYEVRINASSPVNYNIQNKSSVQKEIKVNITINQFNIGNNNTLTIDDIPNQTFTTKAIVPTITVRLNGTVLVKNTDYTYVATNNVNVGTATITVTGIGNFKGTKTTTFNITPYDISGGTMDPISDLTYNGTNQKPEPTVKALSTTLVKGTDFTYSYEDNKDAGNGTGKITITGKGNYKGSKSATFTIKPKPVNVVWGNTSFTFNNANQKPTASVTTGVSGENMALKITGEQKNYRASAYTATAACDSVTSNNRCANYSVGNTTTTFTIAQYSLSGSNSTIANIPAVDYNGTEYKPTPTVTALDVNLVAGTDFTYSYSNNKNAGTATVTIEGKGNYKDTNSKNFTINRIDPEHNEVECATGLIYNGTRQGLISSVNISNSTVYYKVDTKLNASNYSSGSTTKPTELNAKDEYVVYWYALPDNYKAAEGSVTCKISKKPVTVSWTNRSLVYNGVNQKPTATTNTGTGETITFSVSGEKTDVGSNYAASAICSSVSSNNVCANYSYSGTDTTFNITKRPVTYKADYQEKVYDGTALNANASCTLVSGTLPLTTHTATCSNSGSQTVVGSSAKTLNSVTIKVGNTNVTSNYEITRQDNTLKVTKRDITIKATDQNKLHDGTALTANSDCDVVSGSLAPNQTKTCSNSGSITNPGNTPKVLNSVVIKAGNTDVTSNYNLTRQNGTLTVIPTVMNLTYNINYTGGTNPTGKTVEYNKAYGTLASVTRYGYNFAGWFTDASGGTQVTATTIVKALADHTIYAHWTPKPYNCAAGTYLKKNTEGCQTCPAGSYCGGINSSFDPNNDQGITGCPTGYTSDAGNTAQTTCYIKVSCGYRKTAATGTTTAQCDAGSYIAEHRSNYGSNDSCTTCTAGYSCPKGACSQTKCTAGTYSGSGAGACTNCTAGTYNTADGSTSCPNSCPSGFTSAAGISSASSCYRSVSCGYSLAANGTYAACGSGTQSSFSGTKYYGQTVSCSACSAGYRPTSNQCGCEACPNGTYGTNGSSCTSCPSGFSNSGTGNTSSDSCKKTISCGQYITSSGSVYSCSSNQYSSGGTYSYGSSSSCSTASDGYRPTSSQCGQEQCPANTYGTGGSCTSCPSGFTSSAGSKYSSDCKKTISCGQYISSNGTVSSCGSNQYSSGGTYSYGSSSSCSTASDGYRPTSNKCGQEQCPANTYGTGGSCTSCPSGFTSSAGSKYSSDCKITVGCGKKVSSNGTVSDCTSHGYSAGGTVSYGSTLSCTAASDGYRPTSNKCSQEQCPANTYGTGGTCSGSCPSGFSSPKGSTSKSDCKITVGCGKKVSSSGTVSDCTSHGYSAGGTVSYGDSLSCTAASDGYEPSSDKCSQTKCAKGTYGTGGTCSGTCPSGYTSPKGSTSKNDCKITLSCGQSVTSTGSTGSCGSNQYSAGGTINYGSSLSCSTCGNGKRPTSDKCGCESCPSGYYGTSGTCSSCSTQVNSSHTKCCSCESGYTWSSSLGYCHYTTGAHCDVGDVSGNGYDDSGYPICYHQSCYQNCSVQYPGGGTSFKNCLKTGNCQYRGTCPGTAALYDSISHKCVFKGSCNF